MDEIKTFLLQLGLQKNEIATYCALLQLGEASVLEISEFSALKRPTVYNMIKKLMNRGLVTQLAEKKKKYVTSSVESIRDIIARQQKKYFDVLPSLTAFQNVPRGTKPVVRYCDGITQVDEIFRTLIFQLNRGKTLYTTVSIRDLLRISPKAVGEFEMLAVKNQWHICELLLANRIALEYIQNDRNYKKKILPIETDLHENNYMVIADSIFIISASNTPYTLSIENKALAGSLFSLFSVLWNSL